MFLQGNAVILEYEYRHVAGCRHSYVRRAETSGQRLTAA
jgi:hypothetical protein